ncbi:MAG: hypothetical protein IMZ53_12930 [Thermoplasmata archaeon]|nr:hypothetical protein [Thermoplasmata archaeon]
MNKKLNLVGYRFGRLVVIKDSGKFYQNSPLWYCLCDCGNKVSVITRSLRSENTKSCGCFNTDVCTKHGHTWKINGKSFTTREYSTWQDMKQRCNNPDYKQYKDYGGRGVTICDEWNHSFSNFLQYLKDNNMFPKPKNLSIDKINNDGNYEPGNIRWTTRLQQVHNRRCSKE